MKEVVKYLIMFALFVASWRMSGLAAYSHISESPTDYDKVLCYNDIYYLFIIQY